MLAILACLALTQVASDAEEWLKKPTDFLEERYEAKECCLRGFVHCDEQGTWSLASQPSLRSCCIGERPLATLRVELDHSLDEDLIGKIATLKGVMHVEAKHSDDGTLVGLFYLEKAHLIEEKSHFSKKTKVISLLAIAGLFSCVGVYWLSKSRG